MHCINLLVIIVFDSVQEKQKSKINGKINHYKSGLIGFRKLPDLNLGSLRTHYKYKVLFSITDFIPSYGVNLSKLVSYARESSHFTQKLPQQLYEEDYLKSILHTFHGPHQALLH